MDSRIENLDRKVDAMGQMLSKLVESKTGDGDIRRESELEEAIRRAIHGLELTKSSFKSKQIMSIKEELEAVLERKG